MEENKRNFSRGLSKHFGVYAHIRKRRARIIGSGSCNLAYIGRGAGSGADMGLFKRLAARTMGANHRKSRRNIISELKADTAGDAVVEATILFPIMIMIFAALVLLATYLPAQAALQRATQYAATALATELSDTWLFFDESSMNYYREKDIRRLKNVYAHLFTGNSEAQSIGEAIVIDAESRSISSRTGELTVESSIINNLLYKEAVVTATREFPMPVDLSFIGFPKAISVTATSTAVVQNADEFVRNMDMASGFVEFIVDRYNLHNVKDAISSFGSRVTGILGW